MPIDAGRLERLDGFLGSVTPTLALQLARAVEVDRLRGGELPHEAILSALRPRLREATRRLERTPTPKRLVCAVFEDLLVDHRLRKQRGRIARTSIDPVWTWLTQTLIPVAAEKALDAIRAKLMSGGADFADGEVDAFLGIAAEAIINAIPTPDMTDLRAADAVRALGADVAADAHDMARMMQIAPHIRTLQRALLRPVATLHDEDIARVRGVFERVAASQPDCASYIPFFVLGRLSKPWEAMRLTGALTRKADDTMISRTDLGQIGETLLSDLDGCVERLAGIRSDELNAAYALEQVVAFSNLSTGIVRELGIKRDGIWGRHLMKVRGGLSDQMERLIARAPKEIAATLPTVRKGGFGLGGRRVPDLTRSLDPQRAAKAVQLARLIAGSRQHAMAGAFAGLLTQVDEQVTATLRRYTQGLADAVHEMGQDSYASAGKFVDQAVALTAAMDGQQEADTLRRRVQAALVIAPPRDMVA